MLDKRFICKIIRIWQFLPFPSFSMMKRKQWKFSVNYFLLRNYTDNLLRQKHDQKIWKENKMVNFTFRECFTLMQGVFLLLYKWKLTHILPYVIRRSPLLTNCGNKMTCYYFFKSPAPLFADNYLYSFGVLLWHLIGKASQFHLFTDGLYTSITRITVVYIT